MKAKEYLLQIKKLDKLIQNKMIEIEQWKAMATSSTSRLSADKVQTSPQPDKMAEAVHRYIEIEQELNEDIDKLINTKREVISTLEELPPLDYDILHKLYIQNLTIDDVADCLDKSYSWVTTIQGYALKKLQDILNSRGGNDEQQI